MPASGRFAIIDIRERKVRIAIAVVVLVVAGWLLAPRIFSDLRSNGVINANIVTIRSPIDGLIVREPPDVGARVAEGALLLEIQDDISAQPLLSQLDTDLDANRNRLQALQQKHQALEDLQRRLEQQMADYKEDAATRLRHMILEADARQKSWQAVRNERQAAYLRVKELERAGYAAKARVEAAESLFEQAVQEIERAGADSARIRLELQAVGKGVYLGEGRNDVPYSQQRIDEIIISKANLSVEIAEVTARLSAIERHLADEMSRSEMRMSASITSPIEGIVWRRLARVNSVVAKDAEVVKVLDCNYLVIEVPLSEGKADIVATGDQVNVRLQGTGQYLTGTIHDVRGPRAVRATPEMVSDPPVVRKDEVMVTVEIALKDLPVGNVNFCGVGRRAEVAFARRGGGIIRRLFGDSPETVQR
jgi:multidrug resistance efflux pump